MLQVRRQLHQGLRVWNDRLRLRVEEVAIPACEQAHERRQVRVERCGAEVFVHGTRAREQITEVVGADCKHQRQPDGRPHRVATADPIPELEHVRGVDAELGDLRRVRRDRDEVPSHRGFVAAERGHQPGARGAGVRESLQRRERLGRDDEQRLARVEPVERVYEIRAVDIRDEPELHVAPAVGAQRVVSHRRPKITAADADVHDVANYASGVTDAASVADRRGELRHLLQHALHLGHDIDTVDDESGARGHPQSDVQNGAVLGDVDVLTSKHRVDALTKFTRHRKVA